MKSIWDCLIRYSPSETGRRTAFNGVSAASGTLAHLVAVIIVILTSQSVSPWQCGRKKDVSSFYRDCSCIKCGRVKVSMSTWYAKRSTPQRKGLTYAYERKYGRPKEGIMGGMVKTMGWGMYCNMWQTILVCQVWPELFSSEHDRGCSLGKGRGSHRTHTHSLTPLTYTHVARTTHRKRGASNLLFFNFFFFGLFFFFLLSPFSSWFASASETLNIIMSKELQGEEA